MPFLRRCFTFTVFFTVCNVTLYAVGWGEENTALRDAEAAMKVPLLSVTQSPLKAPSGDPHDYVTLSTYAWPNPATPDGLPYISRDGQTNPETEKYPDRKNLELMIKTVRQLTAGYGANFDKRYAQRALALLSAWFLEDSTKMNPNLIYAQIVPGKNGGKGNPSGLIETHNFVDLLDSVAKLEASYPVPDAIRDGLRQWFASYLAWLEGSPNGEAGEKAKNNQLTWFTAQKIAIAEFLRNDAAAKALLKRFVTYRLPDQIEANGAQPEELKRTKSFNYSLVNLQGLFAMARLADRLSFDLWHYKTPSGAGIEKALDFLLPYATGKERWPYKEIQPYDLSLMKSVLKQAMTAYPEKRALYESALERLQAF